MVENADVGSDDYYKVLGLNRDATADDIRKNYRKLSMKYHPDRNLDNKEECERQFKCIGEAYEVLSDERKRQIYNQVGKRGLGESGSSGQGFNPFEMFNSMFGNSGDFMQGFNGMHRQERKKEVIEHIVLTLEQVLSGFKETRQVKMLNKCRVCDGIGCSEVIVCKQCGGKGAVMQTVQIGPGMITQTRTSCGVCSGIGKTGKPGSLCGGCNGSKRIETIENVLVEFPPGSENKETFVKEYETYVYIFVAKIGSHSKFKRDNGNLIFSRDISLCDALCGAEFPVRMIDGRTVIIKSSDTLVIKPDTVHLIRGEGLPIRNNPHIRGDLIIDFKIVFPNTISAERKTYLYKILTKTGQPPQAINIVDKEVLWIDDTTTRSAAHSANSSNSGNREDEEEHTQHRGGHPQAQHVQCANQ
jgi:DnaJ-class molecular chaperone